MKKKVLLILVSSVILLSGCNLSNQVYNAMFDYDYSEMEFIQLREPEEGQQMCVIDTTLGTIKAVLYPDLAPNTVNNFIERINDGFYDNKLIYDVSEGTYFQTGALDDTFKNGVTSDGEPIPAEYSVKLWPFKGALVGIYGTAGYSDSRFFVVNKYEITDEEKEQLRSYKTGSGQQQFPEELIKVMEENEGFWQVSGCFTVFGQTIEGFDVIEKITAVATNEETYRPLEDIYVNSITLTTYTKE